VKEAHSSEELQAAVIVDERPAAEQHLNLALSDEQE